MDVQMPEMDGFEATARIREREKATGGHIPIIAMTAHAIKGDRERCLEAGMDGYVTKPIEADELVRAIVRLVPAAAQGEPNPTARDRAVEVEELLQVFLKRVGGKVEHLKKIVEVFEPESAKALEEIRDAIASRDAPRLQRAAALIQGGRRDLRRRRGHRGGAPTGVDGQSGRPDGRPERLHRARKRDGHCG